MAAYIFCKGCLPGLALGMPGCVIVDQVLFPAFGEYTKVNSAELNRNIFYVI